MNEAKNAFEAIMRIESKENFAFKNGKYLDPSMQVRWPMFLLGWEMREVSK